MTPRFKGIEWGEPQQSNSECSYNHLIGMTPLGRFLITWKGWKDDPGYAVDETPWGLDDLWGWDLAGAKEACERAWRERLQACLIPEAQ